MPRLACWITLLLLMNTLASAQPDQRETVVLLHGVAMPALVMHRVARTLECEGYRVVNLGYPSRTLPIEQIAADFLPAQLAARGVAAAPRLHFVTHSMGSLVLRLYLRDHRPANLGRVVMLGPPNHGSRAADHAAQLAFFRLVAGRNVARRGTGPQAIAKTLGLADYDLGIIAGNRSNNPLFARWLDAPNDGAVAVESARLEGMKDFIILPYSHTPMLWRSAVLAQISLFLRSGRFLHPAAGLS